MNPPSLHIRAFLVALCCCLCLLSCSQSQTRRPSPATNSAKADLSGFWELDYAQSDNIQAKLNALVRDLRQQIDRRNQAAMSQGMGGSVVIGNTGANSGASIIGLAQMADLITQSQLLEIKQDEHRIKVEREGNFALSCEFYPGEFHTVETPLGKEICGWNAHQLVFRILLPEGLSIQHVLSVGAQRQKLNIATTVVSDQVSSPFTLNRVYNRYEPQDNGFTCKMTISRGRVCTTESQ
jgi:hypothetical protein